MATMADVAKLAAVSSSTVSHVLNGTRHVQEETRRRVQDAVAETGYRNNALARSLATSETRTVGLSISALTNPYFGNLVHAIEKRASQAGYTLVLGDSHDDALIEKRVINSLLDRRVDGIIVAPAVGAETTTLPLIATTRTPVVLIDRFVPFDCDQVAPSNIDPVKRITEHLLERGHRRIAAVTGLKGLQSSIERQKGFECAYSKNDPRFDGRLIVCGQSDAGAARQAVTDLFQLKDPPTALVVLNNAMTIGAMRALREMGLKVPDDVAMVCYDDFEWAELFEPRLTAIAQDVIGMGTQAVDMLLERMSGETTATRQQRVPPTYQHRNSCGCN